MKYYLDKKENYLHLSKKPNARSSCIFFNKMIVLLAEGLSIPFKFQNFKLFLLIKACLQNLASIFCVFFLKLVIFSLYPGISRFRILPKLFSKNPRHLLKILILHTQRCIFVFYEKNNTTET